MGHYFAASTWCASVGQLQKVTAWTSAACSRQTYVVWGILRESFHWSWAPATGDVSTHCGRWWNHNDNNVYSLAAIVAEMYNKIITTDTKLINVCY